MSQTKLVVGGKYIPIKDISNFIPHIYKEMEDTKQPYMYYVGSDGIDHYFGIRPNSQLCTTFKQDEVVPYTETYEKMTALQKLMHKLPDNLKFSSKQLFDEALKEEAEQIKKAYNDGHTECEIQNNIYVETEDIKNYSDADIYYKENYGALDTLQGM